MALAALLFLLVPTSSPWNASAEAVAEGSRLLGIDFRQAKDAEGGPSREASQALSRAGAGTWLDAQIEDESAEIGEPPAALREYLELNRDALWTVVAVVERGEPDWGSELFGEDGHLQLPFLPVLRLERILVAAALVEEREGRSIEAGRALDAAWTLGRSVSSPGTLMNLLITIGAERMQVGALRKFRAPPLQWLGRLSSDGPWKRMPDALREEAKLRRRSSEDSVNDDFSEVWRKASSAVAGSLEKRSACDPSLGSDKEIWQPATKALAAETNASKRAIRDFYEANMGETVGNAVRRAARLEVDREMTLKVLQLRLDKESSRDGAWPEKMSDTTSAACPEASYSYESTAETTLRFLGSVEAPKGSLPLALRARNDAKEVPDPNAPTPPPTATPTPSPR